MKKIPNLPKIREKGRLFYSPDIQEKYIYKKINKEIKKKYSININSRNTIIKNIVSILTQGDRDQYKMLDLSVVIIRTDIENFYPSIDKHQLYRKISQSNVLNSDTLKVLKPLFFSNSIKGVPLGLPFSSSLSEIYLEDFDTDILIFFNPIFYFRYVDDIIIILNSDYQTEIQKRKIKENNIKKLQDIFNSYSLMPNKEKTTFTYHKKKMTGLEFEYLGYHFKNINNKLQIDISDKKTEKIISQIKHYFGVFKNGKRTNVDFWKLYYRLQHTIYGITSTDRSSKSTQFGLAFSYRFINHDGSLNKIINQIRYNIYSCKLSSNKKFTLLNLIEFENTSLEILERKYDYRKLTIHQIKKINKRLNIKEDNTSIEKLFYIIHDNKYK